MNPDGPDPQPGETWLVYTDNERTRRRVKLVVDEYSRCFRPARLRDRLRRREILHTRQGAYVRDELHGKLHGELLARLHDPASAETWLIPKSQLHMRVIPTGQRKVVQFLDRERAERDAAEAARAAAQYAQNAPISEPVLAWAAASELAIEGNAGKDLWLGKKTTLSDERRAELTQQTLGYRDAAQIEVHLPLTVLAELVCLAHPGLAAAPPDDEPDELLAAAHQRGTSPADMVLPDDQ